METDDFMRRVVERRIDGPGPRFIEILQCGHINSTGRLYIEKFIPCLTCEAEAEAEQKTKHEEPRTRNENP